MFFEVRSELQAAESSASTLEADRATKMTGYVDALENVLPCSATDSSLYIEGCRSSVADSLFAKISQTSASAGKSKLYPQGLVRA